MGKKQFKAESKKMLDLMINSIYTNREIFLRELISNASDALDKRYYEALAAGEVGVTKEDSKIQIIADKENRTLTIRDNGIGMTEAELDNNLGTIAKSGSQAFRERIATGKESGTESTADIIGQFGVGFYSAFMVASEITVTSRSISEETAHQWTSTGISGYTITEAEKEDVGTDIVLKLKEDSEEDYYSDLLDEYKLKALVKKYSDYVHYPIVLGEETLNSMTPIWKKSKSEVTEEEYAEYYKDKFNDFQEPARVIRTSLEGLSSYTALLFIPKHAPYDYYDVSYEKGLALYSSGVLIMDKCKELVLDHFNFVRGTVDTQDLSLNISRETLQQDRQLRNIARNLDKKIKSELKAFMKDDREGYEEFFHAFGSRLKYGIYESYGQDKDLLADLLIFYDSKEEKMISLDEYIEAMPEGQEEIYFAAGETNEKIDILPQVRSAKENGKDILYMTDRLDEFVVRFMQDYQGKKFTSVLELNETNETEEEKEASTKANEENKSFLEFLQESLGEQVAEVNFSAALKDAPAALSNKGEISLQMEKTLSQMPLNENMKAERVLTLNPEHGAVTAMLKHFEEGTEEGKSKVARAARLLLAQSLLISGLTVEDPLTLSQDITSLIAEN